jgi:hypothetical protein
MYKMTRFGSTVEWHKLSIDSLHDHKVIPDFGELNSAETNNITL